MTPKKKSPTFIAAAIALPLCIGFGLSHVADRGTAERKNGIATVARIARADDGSCTVGIKHHHCYQLTFEVLPEDEPAFVSHLDVNVADRWASRIQPGSLVWVVRDRSAPRDVALAVEAFAEPPPAAPQTTQ